MLATKTKNIIEQNTNIPKFRRKIGDIFRSMILPIAVYAFLAIFYGIFDLLIEMKIPNYTNLNIVKSVFKKLIKLVPMLTAISVATTFSSNRTIGGISALMGWIGFLAIQTIFIKENTILSETYAFQYWPGKTLKWFADSELVTKIPVNSSNSIYFVNSNMIVGFLIGYINALILSKITKKVSGLTNITLLNILIAISFSLVLGILHIFIIMGLANQLYASYANIVGLTNSKANYLVTSIISGLLLPLNLNGITESIYKITITPYYKLLFAIFMAPTVAIILIMSAKKSNRKFAFSFYITLILISTLLGQYEPILISMFFISPIMFILFGVGFTSVAAWIVALTGLSVFPDAIINGNIFEYIFNFLIPMFKKQVGYSYAWLIIVIGIIYAALIGVFTWVYVHFAKVVVLGKWNADKKIFAYEYIVENNYIVFSKFNNDNIDEPIRHQVSDALLNIATNSISQTKDGEIAINSITEQAKKLGYTKEITAYLGIEVNKKFSKEPIVNETIEQVDALKLNKSKNEINEETFEKTADSDFQINESQDKDKKNDVFVNADNIQYTTEITPAYSTELNMVESSLSVPTDVNVKEFLTKEFIQSKPNLSEFEQFNLESTDDELDSYDDFLNTKTKETVIFLDKNNSIEENTQTQSKASFQEKEEIKTLAESSNKENTGNDFLNDSSEFSTNNEFSKLNKEENKEIDIQENEFVDENYNNLMANLSFDEISNSQTHLNSNVSDAEYIEAFIKPIEKEIFNFESRIKNFVLLSPLLGEVVKQTSSSIEIISTSGKLIMPNDAKVEYVSDIRDEYILNIYGVRVQILLNPDFSKEHKQHLHNKIYVNQGKQLYKGDFFIDANKKFYSEIDQQMVLTINLLKGDYTAKIIEKPLNSKVNKWDGLFEITLHKEIETKLRVGQKQTEKNNE